MVQDGKRRNCGSGGRVNARGRNKYLPVPRTTVTYPPILKGNGDVTKAYFEPCLKEKCPAFYILHGERGKELERCKVLR